MRGRSIRLPNSINRLTFPPTLRKTTLWGVIRWFMTMSCDYHVISQQKSLNEPGWSKEETDHLFELCRYVRIPIRIFKNLFHPSTCGCSECLIWDLLWFKTDLTRPNIRLKMLQLCRTELWKSLKLFFRSVQWKTLRNATTVCVTDWPKPDPEMRQSW